VTEIARVQAGLRQLESATDRAHQSEEERNAPSPKKKKPKRKKG
jgi:hypothetical protein